MLAPECGKLDHRAVLSSPELKVRRESLSAPINRLLSHQARQDGEQRRRESCSTRALPTSRPRLAPERRKARAT